MRRVEPWEIATIACVVAVCYLVLRPVFAQSPINSHSPSCFSRVKMLALANTMYAEDYDGRFPNRDRWMDATRSYIKMDVAYHCPEVESGGKNLYGYAFNSALSNKGIAGEPRRTPLVYDSVNLGRNASDPFSSLPVPGRHKGFDTVGYADGHVHATEGGR